MARTSDILTAIGCGAFVASDFLFAYAGKKDAEEGKKGWYVPATLCTVAGIASVVASNRYSNREIAALTGLAGCAAKAVSDYQKAVAQLPEEQQESLEKLMNEADAADETDSGYSDDKSLYYLPQYQIMFWAMQQEVTTAELNLNQRFTHDGNATLYDFLDELKIEDKELLDHAQDIGWRFNYDDYDSGIQYITFTQYQKMLSKGIVCNYIYFQVEAQSYDAWAKEYNDED